MVDNQVIVEIKAMETVAPVHKKQLGLLINFNGVPIKAGITRIVNGLEPKFRKQS